MQATAIHTLAYILDSVETVTPADEHIFSDYILPSLAQLMSPSANTTTLVSSPLIRAIRAIRANRANRAIKGIHYQYFLEQS